MILLPGGVLPAQLAFADLLEELGEDVRALTRDLEVYAEPEPPPGYGLDLEVEGILREADEAGFERFNLVGYSAGGAASILFAARHPERLRSLALLEPAWAGNEGLGPVETAVWGEVGRIMSMPSEQMMASFVRVQLAPGVEPPPRPDPPPPWMASRPAGLKAIAAAFEMAELDLDALRGFPGPTYFALGGLSNQDYYATEAERLSQLFQDFELEVFEDRHHFDPPHRAEPKRLADSLRTLWARADSKES